ncbi:MAG: hypothetical protein ACO32Z_05950, partial [Gemmatimonadaceae bacterium]
GLTRSGDRGGSATLLYSAVGPRIFSAGTVPYPDVLEATRHLIDLSVRLPISARAEISLDARNLLDAPFRLTQGPVVREGYRTGRGITVGMRWR